MTSLIRFTGTAFSDKTFENGAELHVTVTTPAGEVVADAFGKVAAVTFRPRKDAPDVIERIHSVRVT